MKKIIELFNIQNAKSKGFENYEEGNVAFITNGDYENAVLGYVKPQNNDRVFNEKSICLSSFCEASIPTTPFLPRGNGGSGLIVLVPKIEMSEEELYFYASQLNMFKWKFSFSRMLIGRRIRYLDLIEFKKASFKIKQKISEFLPKEQSKQSISEKIKITIFKVDDLCNIEKKKALPQNVISLGGKTPYVTTTSFNNGVSDFADEEPNAKGKCLSVALNGSVGEVFFQLDDFITSGDNAVLTLKDNYNPYLLFYIGAMIKTHQWKYNYYRKMTIGKLKKLVLPIPTKEDNIYFELIEKIVKNSYGYDKIKKYL